MSRSLAQGLLLLAFISLTSAQLAYVDITSKGLVNVSFGSGYVDNDDYNSPPRMFLSLSINETALAADDFDPLLAYNCSSPLCVEEDVTSVDYNTPDAAITIATRANATVQLAGSDSWALSSSAVFISDNYLDLKYSEDDGVYGFIGLGTDGNATNNFKNNFPYFSIYLYNDTNGQLIFGYNDSLANQSIIPTVLQTDANWKTNVSYVTLGDFQANISTTTLLVFDLIYGHGEERPILLSTELYDAVTDQLDNIKGVTSDDFYAFEGNLSALPNLTIVTSGANLTLTPDVYTVYSEDDNNYRIMIADRSDVLEYLNGNEDTQDFIVIGWDVLMNFYPVFAYNNGSPSITLYTLSSSINSTTDATNSTTDATNSTSNSTDSGTTVDPNAGTTNSTTNSTTTNTTTDGNTTTTGTTTNGSGSSSHVWVVLLVIILVVAGGAVAYFSRLRRKKAEIEAALKDSAIRV